MTYIPLVKFEKKNSIVFSGISDKKFVYHGKYLFRLFNEFFTCFSIISNVYFNAISLCMSRHFEVSRTQNHSVNKCIKKYKRKNIRITVTPL